jgi:hypothetical protein
MAAFAGVGRAGDKSPDQAELEKKFIERMTNATLEGSFTIDGMRGNRPPSKDKYTISSVAKVKGDDWTITARIEYFTINLEVPVPVVVKWAGDTAVIQLTNAGIAGMTGKFSTRLLIDGERYAGTWKHNEHGGHMWGRITKTPPAPTANGKTAAKQAATGRPSP